MSTDVSSALDVLPRPVAIRRDRAAERYVEPVQQQVATSSESAAASAAAARTSSSSSWQHRALFQPSSPSDRWQVVHHRLPRISSLGADRILVRTSHAGLTPFDWQAVAYGFGAAGAGGRDGAGVVVEVGSDESVKRRFKIGDRVWFCSNSADGTATAAFQDYSTHRASQVARVPDNISKAQAAALGTGLVTACVALFKTLECPLERLLAVARGETTAICATHHDHHRPWLLVWGGAGVTGVFLIQLAAKVLGMRVICAASPVNFDYVRSLGAEVVIDRWLQGDEIIEQIREATHDDVHLAIDNVGTATASLCTQVLYGSRRWRKEAGVDAAKRGEATSSCATLVALAGSPKAAALASSEDAIRTLKTPRISFSTTFYADDEFSSRVLDATTLLLERGIIVPARVEVVDGGLAGINDGLDRMRRGKAPSARRLVARLEDTPSGGDRKRLRSVERGPEIDSAKRSKRT